MLGDCMHVQAHLVWCMDFMVKGDRTPQTAAAVLRQIWTVKRCTTAAVYSIKQPVCVGLLGGQEQ
jgi:hypothetical protein